VKRAEESNSCHDVLARLWAYIDGELDYESADEVRTHIEVCKRCYPQYPEGTGHGGPGYMIKGEFSDVKHVRGVVSMARLTHPDTAGSQFFICLAEAKHLDGSYAAFGRVLRGADVLEQIEAAGTKGGTPSETITLTRILIRERTQAELQAETLTASHDS
jgi:cyclophilin family peptidyl-prolyl cis-trans isomerase